MATVLFHLPYTRTGTRVDASLARPRYLIEAFQSEGYEVVEISGLAKQRRQAIRALRARLKRGDHIDLMYSESHAVPNVIANWKDNRVLQGAFLDYRLFRTLRRRGVPTMLFLRDVKWSMSDFMSARPRLVRNAVKALYALDLWLYRRSIDILYVPTEPVRDLVPFFPKSRIRVLPPAGPSVDASCEVSPTHKNVIYVGNVGGDLYSIHPLFGAAVLANDWELTVCVPERAWELAKNEYKGVDLGSAEIVHRSGSSLAESLRHATLGALVYPPHPYRSIAFPAKVLEYCAYGLPIVASEGTYAAHYVVRHGIGWSCAATPEGIAHLIDNLSLDEIERASSRARQHATGQTWRDRVQQVIEDSILARR